METPLWLFILAVEFPTLLGLLDCVQRPADHFPGGQDDKKAWTRWLVVAIPLFLFGYGILLGYYFVVIRRNAPGTPR